MSRLCCVCGADISDRGARAVYCKQCAQEVRKVSEAARSQKTDKLVNRNIVCKPRVHRETTGPGSEMKHIYYSCRKCGFILNQQDRFCRYCGQRLKPESEDVL